LKEAENRLRHIIVEAAKLGDYESIDLARAVAGRLHEIFDEHVPVKSEASARQAATGAMPASIPQSSAARKQRHRSRNLYPRFQIDRGVLHKVGWSKKDREEYVHKIPKDVYDLVVRAISDASHGGKRMFASDGLVQQLQSQEPPVPAYQVYVTLALLRSRQIVEKKGREGYLAVADVVSRGLRAWSELEDQRGTSKR
jgi:hypothetical protein